MSLINPPFEASRLTIDLWLSLTLVDPGKTLVIGFNEYNLVLSGWKEKYGADATTTK